MILLTGASGYVGSRLLRELEAAGRTMRCLAGARARGGQPNHDRSRKGRRSRRIVAGRGDGGCGPGVLSRALHGERCAVRGARSRVGGQLRACRPSGRRTPHHLSRGLTDDASSLSTHLKSRLETGETLTNAASLPPTHVDRLSSRRRHGWGEHELLRLCLKRIEPSRSRLARCVVEDNRGHKTRLSPRLIR
jgi:hypothetical protein